MKGKQQIPIQPIESRWPVVLAISVTIGILAVLPERIRLTPFWFPHVSGAVVIIPIISVSLSKHNQPPERSTRSAAAYIEYCGLDYQCAYLCIAVLAG